MCRKCSIEKGVPDIGATIVNVTLNCANTDIQTSTLEKIAERGATSAVFAPLRTMGGKRRKVAATAPTEAAPAKIKKKKARPIIGLSGSRLLAKDAAKGPNTESTAPEVRTR